MKRRGFIGTIAGAIALVAMPFKSKALPTSLPVVVVPQAASRQIPIMSGTNEALFRMTGTYKAGESVEFIAPPNRRPIMAIGPMAWRIKEKSIVGTMMQSGTIDDYVHITLMPV